MTSTCYLFALSGSWRNLDCSFSCWSGCSSSTVWGPASEISLMGLLKFDEFKKDVGLPFDGQLHMSQVGLHNKFLSDPVVNNDLPHFLTKHVWTWYPEWGLHSIHPDGFVESLDIKFVVIVDNSDIMISGHVDFSSMSKRIGLMESKVRFGFEREIKFALERIQMWGNRLVDGEDIWSVDSGELIFREESTIEHHRVMVGHLVQ